MVNSGERQFTDNRCTDPADQNSDVEESVDVSCGCIETPATANPSFSRRLTDIFMENGDEDLLMEMTDFGDAFLQWFSALDMQVIGACRADERLKPLLTLNISGGEAEDHLLARLCEHFEPSEVGLLARCLCAPLISIRVGKIDKQETLLCPTSMRGNLFLTLLPSSDLRVSFTGDDGPTERLATLSSESQCTSIEIEEISADKSGRSFLLRIADNVVSYFWCSEKSQLLGREKLKKMKDLLMRKPTLAELTGINDERIDSFATQLKAYLGGSTVCNAHVLPSRCPSDDSFDSSRLHFPQSSFTCDKRSQHQQYSYQGSTTNLAHLGGLYPKSSIFEPGQPESLSLENITAKLMQVGDANVLSNSSPLASTNDADVSSSIRFTEGKLPQANLIDPFAVLDVVDAFGKPLDLPVCGPKVQVPSSSSSHLYPHYCWCPPVASTLHYTLRNSLIPSSSTESLHLPPLTSLLSAAGSSSLLTSRSSLNMSDFPAKDFPGFRPEPLMSLPSSHQIPAFTPLMCDSIVHIPMIDVCSSGPGYLVNAGPTIATTISPLNMNLVDPLISNSESVVEQSARETLCMLINSTNNQPNLKLSNSDDQPNVLGIGGSRGFYCGTRDFYAVSDAPTNMSFMFLSDKSPGDSVGQVCPSRGEAKFVSVDQKMWQDANSSGSHFG